MITESQVKDVLKTIDSLGEVDNIGADDVLTSLGVDSLDLFDVFVQLDEITGIKVSDEEIDNLKTINKILTFYNSGK